MYLKVVELFMFLLLFFIIVLEPVLFVLTLFDKELVSLRSILFT